MGNHGTTRWLVLGNGDVHQTTDAHTALDEHDDALLIRELDKFGPGTIDGEWDQFIGDNGENLKSLGILSEDGSMTNTTKLRKLHNGAIWQGYQRQLMLMQLLEEEIPGITERMQSKLSKAKMPQLPTKIIN